MRSIPEKCFMGLERPVPARVSPEMISGSTFSLRWSFSPFWMYQTQTVWHHTQKPVLRQVLETSSITRMV